MELREGYKKTEIGVIPDDWEVNKLKKIVNLKQGIQCGVDKQKKELKDGLVRFIRIIDLTNDSELPRYIRDPGVLNHIKKDDLFMVRYGSPGLLGYGYEGVIANNLFSIKPISNQNRLYLYYLLTFLNKKILELSSSTTMAALNFTSLKELLLFFPPKVPEQKAIAEVLSDTDELIQTLEKQIAKKHLIKQGAMQKLLTPKDDWEVKRLGEIFTFKQGVQCGVEKQVNGKINGFLRFIRIVDLNQEGEPQRFIRDPGCSHHIRKNDLFMVRYGNPGLLGYGYEGVIANNLFSLKPLLKIYRLFFYFLLSNKKDEILELSSSTTMAAINFTSLKALEMIYPKSIDEQTRIATILSDMDNEIEMLENKLAKYKKIKQGMMQELLTGKTRLV